MSLVTGWNLGGRGTDMENLEQALYNDFIHSIKKMKGKGYTPSRFIGMLGMYGAVQTAKKLINKPNGDYSEGFEKLYEFRMLDASLEYYVAYVDKYKSLFSEEERQICRDRLAKYQ